MKFTFDIDTGGTFTDGYVSGNGRVERIKVDTTPHDLTAGFFNLIKEAAKKFQLETTNEMLKHTEVIRFSTTIGTNTIIQKSGSKLGLIVSRGFADSAYSSEKSKNPVFDFLISRDMVCGIRGKVDVEGKITEKLDVEEIRSAVKELLVKGARMIVVSLSNSFINPSLERKVKEIIEIDYPKHYLGSVPVLISTEIDLSKNDMCRTNAALLNAYIHRDMVKFLYKADEDLSRDRYIAPLLIGHNWGGVARVSKTKAIATYNSGPVAGLYGAAHIGRLYGLSNMVTVDVGGTSTDIGTLVEGKPPLLMESVIGGVTTKLAIVDITSIGAGGGSVAKVENGKLKVGPESAGAIPGPACYDLGGNEPTVTDAAVVLGYLNQEYFLGGRKKLNPSKAREAIEQKIAEPLKFSVEKAAFNIIKEQTSFCGEAVKKFLNRRNIRAEETSMLSIGGCGGILCADIAEAVGIPAIYTPPFASVFSAFGSSIMDIAHQYEVPVMQPLRKRSGEYLNDWEMLNKTIEDLQEHGLRDMKTEGGSDQRVIFSLEVQLSNSKSNFLSRIPWTILRFKGQKDIETLCRTFEKTDRKWSIGEEILLERFILRASCPISHPELPTVPMIGKSPEAALKSKREVYWTGSIKGIPTYEQNRLQCGNVVDGPAIIEGEDTTIRIPEAWQYSVDRHLFGIIQRKDLSYGS